jgi:molybdate transport system regulatory protein
MTFYARTLRLHINQREGSLIQTNRAIAHMTDIRVFIRLNLPNGNRIGPGKIALLEAIRAEGSITAAARYLGMSYRRAWLLVQEINNMLRHPAITTTQGGAKGSGAAVTQLGRRSSSSTTRSKSGRAPRRTSNFKQSLGSFASADWPQCRCAHRGRPHFTFSRDLQTVYLIRHSTNT